MTISELCVRPGDVQTITVPLGTGGSSVVHVVVTYPDGTRQHNIAAATGADGKFVYSWTVESNARAGISEVWVTVLMPHLDTAIADYHFAIGVAGQPCNPPPNEGPGNGVWLLPGPVTGSVRKVCDQGVSGSAVFRLSVVLPAFGSQRYADAFSLPTSSDVSVACNGEAAELPTLTVGIALTLHEVQLPAGAARAADTTVTMDGDIGQAGPAVVVNNAHATAVVTATPKPAVTRRLAQTGGGPPQPAPLALALVIGGLLALSASAILTGLGRKRHP